MPGPIRHVLSEIGAVSVNRLIELNYRLAILFDHMTLKGPLSSGVEDALLDYLQDHLERQVIAEDEDVNKRSKLVELLCSREERLSVEAVRAISEATLSTFSRHYCIEQNNMMLSKIYGMLRYENDRPENSAGLERSISFRDGRVYQGCIKGGKKNGQGTLKFPNGDAYCGAWDNGNREGAGRYEWVSGDRYDGEYLNNLRHGQGVFLFADGKTYTGGWEAGLRSGKGKLTWPNGDVYEGDFSKGQRTGEGQLRS